LAVCKKDAKLNSADINLPHPRLGGQSLEYIIMIMNCTGA